MPQPVWRKIRSEVLVPEQYQPSGPPQSPPQSRNRQWTLALEYLTAGKILMLEVVDDPQRAIVAEWQPFGFSSPCSPDGDFDDSLHDGDSPPGAPLVVSAPPGALIARIGGSTTDQILDTAATPARVVFSVGRKCVFTVPASPTGPLFLGVNDHPTRMARVIGQLRVNIFEAI